MAEEAHVITASYFPEGIPAFGRRKQPCTAFEANATGLANLRYEQDAHGRYLVTDAGVLATITGITGLESQRLGRELAMGPEALDAIGFALDDLADLAEALAERGITSGLIAEIRITLVAVLARAGRPTERYHSRAGAPPRPA